MIGVPGVKPCIGVAVGMALAACVHTSRSTLPQDIAAKCQTPVSWVKLGQHGGTIVDPPRDADYKKVDCILGELRVDLTGITFIGNEALPADHPVEQARKSCRATNAFYDASGPVLIVRIGGYKEPAELSRQAACMRDKLAGTGFKVEFMPGN